MYPSLYLTLYPRAEPLEQSSIPRSAAEHWPGLSGRRGQYVKIGNDRASEGIYCFCDLVRRPFERQLWNIRGRRDVCPSLLPIV
jgi:hypothetical protein